jgi:signal transduction histidine kinase/ligand-binding sensor domain-containing protein
MKALSFSKLKVIFFLLFLNQTDFGFAQQPALDFSNVRAYEPYIGHKSIAIVQDSTGYLWIGTDAGLLRYDGQSILPYQHVKDDQNTLPDNKVHLLFVDREKNLWVCTSRGLCRYNPEQDNFSPVIVESNLRGAPEIYVDEIAEDQTGQLYIANQNLVYKFDKTQNLFLKVTELKGGKITALVFDDQNNFWIGASNNGGLFYYNQKDHYLTPYLNKPNDKNSISNNEINDVALVKGNIWIAAYGGGIDFYNPELKTFKHYVSPFQYENFSLSIYIDRKKNLWISTLGSLKLYDPKKDIFYNYYYDQNNPKSLRKDLWRFYQDKQENYWTIQSIGGISFARIDNNFKHYDNLSANYWRTSEKSIAAIAEDQSGNLWIGNYYNGIDVFNWKENRTIRFVHQDKDKKSLGAGTITGIFRDSRQQMWIGSNLGGLQRFNPQANNFETYINNPNDTTSIANNDIRSITEDVNGNLWCIVHGKGVDRFDPQKQIFYHYNSKNNHLGNDYAFKVFFDSKQNLWVPTVYGLSFLKRGEHVFKNFVSDPKDTTSINGNEIHTVYEDSKHNIWASSLAGLNKYDPETGKFTRFSAGLRSKHIFSILGDHNNFIWVSSASGISKLDPASGKFTNFDQNDGLLSKEYYDNSCLIDGNNQIYFGGFDGIDIFNPDSLKKVPKQPNLTFTDFRIFYKSLTAKTDSTILDKHINYTNNIILNYKQNSLGFRYTAIDLTNSGKLTYNYQLDGFDNNWIESEGVLEANYTNLKPGTYTFKVRARYEDEEWGKKELAIVIQIVPAWWMTTWFKIILGLVLVLAPFIIVFWRIRLLRSQREKLQKLVAERTNEILNKNDLLKSQAMTLEQKNDQLSRVNSEKDKYFSIIAHDLRGPFNGFLGLTQIMTEELDTLSKEELLRMAKGLEKSASSLFRLLENLLNWSRMKQGLIPFNPTGMQLLTVVDESIAVLLDQAKIKEIDIAVNISADLSVFADTNMLQTIIRNLVSNALKFTHIGGKVTISACNEDASNIIVTIKDTGIGMSSEMVDNLFRLDAQTGRPGTDGESSSGLGLLLSKEFVEKQGGKIWAESEEGVGSTFYFTLVINNS